MRNADTLPQREGMKRGHKVRKFRRGNTGHGRAYLGHKQKPWKRPTRSAA
jgi:hypothetical protein